MKTSFSREAVLTERLRRQGFLSPLRDRKGYEALFRRLQPVAPVYFSRPGDPPRMVHRTGFDDGAEADRMRAARRMVKGRFLGGNIGYVLAKDLGLYAAAFRRPLAGLNEAQRAVLKTVQTMGGLTPRQIKEETGLLIKAVMPALHRLQEAFLVYEDQVDSAWERCWYDFGTEWPDVDLEGEPWEISAAEVVRRFLGGHVFATMEQIGNWSQLPSRPLKALVSGMEKRRAILPVTVEGIGEGWVCAEDASLGTDSVPASVFMLHKADFLVLSHAGALKRRFEGREVLQYLLIDGAFQGAVLGHWRIGPHDVEDIVVELPAPERKRRREEVLKAVARQYRPPHSRILRYDGKAVAARKA